MMKIKLIERIRGAIRGFKDPLYEKVPFELLAYNSPASCMPPVFSQKKLQFQTLCGRAWMDIPNLNDPSDEYKERVKAHAMTELVKGLEPYVLAQDDIDVNGYTYQVLVELQVVVPDV